MKNIKRILAALIFLFIFTELFFTAGAVLMHKQTEGRFNMTAKVAGFYNEEKDSFDVMFFGSSHMYCSVDPAVFYDETGLTSYVFATQLQPLWVTYHYMVDALKTQSPKVAAVEIYMSELQDDYSDEGTNHTAIDPMPLSLNKWKVIEASAPKGERRYYLFHIMKYHERWEDLKREDFIRAYEKGRDPDKGHVRLTSAAIDIEREDIADVNDTVPISDKNIHYINKMIDLAKSNGVKIVFFKSPSNATKQEKMFYNGVSQILNEKGVRFIDYNSDELYKEMGLNLKTDFYDRRHLNESGMRKFVAHFASFIMEDKGCL